MITDTINTGCFAAALKRVFLQCSGVGLLNSRIEEQQHFVGHAILHANVEWLDTGQNVFGQRCMHLDLVSFNSDANACT